MCPHYLWHGFLSFVINSFKRKPLSWLYFNTTLQFNCSLKRLKTFFTYFARSYSATSWLISCAPHFLSWFASITAETGTQVASILRLPLACLHYGINLPTQCRRRDSFSIFTFASSALGTSLSTVIIGCYLQHEVRFPCFKGSTFIKLESMALWLTLVKMCGSCFIYI